MFRALSCLEKSTFRVRVSGLPWMMPSSEIFPRFQEYGATSWERVTSETGKDLGQCLVSFPSVEQAIEAQRDLNGSFFALPAPHGARKLIVSNDFKGPRIMEEVYISRKPTKRRLIKLVRDKALGARWPTEPVMASTNESRMLRRYKTGGLPRSHDRQR